MPDEVIISLRDVTKAYKRGQQTIAALQDASIDIKAGEFVAITGSSGSGKSTLLQLMGGLDRPSRGDVEVNGVDIGNLDDSALSVFRSKTVGFVFQFFYMQPYLSTVKNVELPGVFAKLPRTVRTERGKALLERMGLAERAGYLPGELSGGQMQRAVIARALLNNPKILLADEPTGNLDSKNSASIIDLFEKIRSELGMTVVIVTHNPEIAERADRQIELIDGMIVS